MHTWLLRAASVALLAACVGGCGCSGEEIYGNGDTGTDGVVPDGIGPDAPDGTDIIDGTDVLDGADIPWDTHPGDADDPGLDPDAGMDPWDDPATDLMGEPGWRDSTDPFCREPVWELVGWDVWSDPRGVFALVEEINTGGVTCPPPTPEDAPGQHYLAFNDGTGWDMYFGGNLCDSPMGCWRRMTGIPGGTLCLLVQGFMCSPTTTVTEGPLTLVPFEVKDLFVVDATLAFSILDTNMIAFFDGAVWGPYPPDPLPLEADVIWADRESLFVAGSNGLVMSHEDTGWRIHDTGTLDDMVELWGFGPDDVWAGTFTGRMLHWNGDEWSDVPWPRFAPGCADPERIEEMWGSGGTLFFHTRHDLVEWDGAMFRNLMTYPCGAPYREITGLWGNAPDEVFIGVRDETLPADECDPLFVLCWDGSEFHRF